MWRSTHRRSNDGVRLDLEGVGTMSKEVNQMEDRATPDRCRPDRSVRSRRSGGVRAWLGGVAVAALLAGGCDLTVSNPGPVTDEFLNDELAQPALVNTVGHAFLTAFNRVAYQQLVVTREVHWAGQTGAHGFSVDAHLGRLMSDNVNVQWNNSQQARWIAEDSVERMRAVLGEGFSNNPNAAGALTWAAFTYRLMGENFCEAVFDGGPPEPGERFLDRAEELFTEAMQVAQQSGSAQVHMAARAGRAQVRVALGNWEAAVADAAQVPTDFLFTIQTSGLADEQHNRVYWGSSNNPWRAHSQWNTFYEDYYRDTGDPRVPWRTDPDVPYGNSIVEGIGNIPWMVQTKYTAQDDPYPLAKGTEMRLIEAEHMLRGGDWQGAMEMINDLRSRYVSDHDGEPIPLWEAASSEEAWTHLKRERGIVLWAEGRRLGDLRRWIQEGTPGETDDMTGRSLCYPIAEGERRLNPNVSIDHPEAPTG